MFILLFFVGIYIIITTGWELIVTLLGFGEYGLEGAIITWFCVFGFCIFLVWLF